MNNAQRYVLVSAAVLVFATLVCVPYKSTTTPTKGAGVEYSVGYGFVFAQGSSARSVDRQMILVEWAGIALVAGILCLAFRDRDMARPIGTKWP
jgi:hypothetical protein